MLFGLHTRELTRRLMASFRRGDGRVKEYGLDTVWSTFTPLATSAKAVNLGQGFPDMPAADFVKRAAEKAVSDDACTQYSPSRGRPSLLKQLASDYSRDFGDRVLDPASNFMVTLGANQGIFVALQTYLSEGDEVILLEPYFDIYKPSVRIAAGACARVVQLVPPADACSRDTEAGEWTLDIDSLKGAVHARTKAILLNTPHNPTGKVYTRHELEAIAKVAIDHDLLVISDEVYDELYYTSTRPVRIASLPGMWERTITVGSAGKRFGVTGWRIGWLLGPRELIDPVLAVHSRTVYAAPSPLQEACAAALEEAARTNYFELTRGEYREKLGYLHQVFRQLGIPCSVPQGGYFMMVNTKSISPGPLPEPRDWLEFPGRKEPHDYQLARWLTETIGVAAIPPSAFYEHEDLAQARDWLRFCFCKRQDTLATAAERLGKLQNFIKR